LLLKETTEDSKKYLEILQGITQKKPGITGNILK